MAALVVVTHYSYKWMARTPEQASEIFYVLRGFEGTIVFWWLSRYWKSGLAAIFCYWGMFEEAQTAACGIGEYHLPALGSGLCVEKFGILPYAIISSSAVLYLWKKHARKTRPDGP